MVKVIRADTRGSTQLKWLDSKHTFSFADYHNPEMMGFGPLRVINEDVVAPGQGFGAHPHRDMEIITYVLQGALEHRDSMGTGEVINAGEVQRMTAGSGVIHSEFNASRTEPVHLFQIWILPNARNLQPGYEQKKLQFRKNEWTPVASGDSQPTDALTIHQDVRLFVADIDANQRLSYAPKAGKAWIQVTKGSARIAEHQLSAGDGVAFENQQQIEIEACVDAQVLLFDV